MRCPVCKAENTRGPECRRCKADLALLFQLEEQRQYAMERTRLALSRAKWADAIGQAAQVNWLRSDAESLQLLAVAHFLNREFAEALRYHAVVVHSS
jgi:hypothetical protein